MLKTNILNHEQIESLLIEFGFSICKDKYLPDLWGWVSENEEIDLPLGSKNDAIEDCWNTLVGKVLGLSGMNIETWNEMTFDDWKLIMKSKMDRK